MNCSAELVDTGATNPFPRPLPQRLAAVVIALVVLNLADGLLTLLHVQRGAMELNPFMGLLLEQGPLVFLVGKYLLVAAAALVIAAHAKERLALVGLRFVLLPAYGMVATYQLVLLLGPAV